MFQLQNRETRVGRLTAREKQILKWADVHYAGRRGLPGDRRFFRLLVEQGRKTPNSGENDD